MTVVEIRQLAAEKGMPFTTLYKRICNMGWTLERALSVPYTKTRSKKVIDDRQDKLDRVMKRHIQNCGYCGRGR